MHIDTQTPSKSEKTSLLADTIQGVEYRRDSAVFRVGPAMRVNRRTHGEYA